ncbi:MAG: tRNA (adenosine(37)-N6)-dimethylallyltransferase MiaA [Clostridia bacterium]|nr:tRNA (adenosine(37)-N6)-dimethylallyltransferase MiaA [Clostridia bacterium]
MINNKVIFIVGPTASGKTSLSLEIAKHFDGEIISADSMQIYNGIHIASAAPDEAEKQGIPHHLIEFLEADNTFSVADYVLLARKKIDEIISRGKLPIVVGGTGLYIDSLVDNIEFIEEKTDYELRSKLEAHMEKIGAEEMLKELSKFDKTASEKLHPNNRRRIIRAFEVYLSTGKTITEQNINSKNKKADFDSLIIGINFSDREKLYDRINKRVDIMLEKGLLNEAKSTFKKGNGNGCFQAIGHKELYKYLEDECSLEESVENLKRQTRRYAKRQITWFGRDERINWIYPDTQNNYLEKAFDLVNEFLKEE